MGPLGGGSHVSTAGGLLAVMLRSDEGFAAPLVDNACMVSANFPHTHYLLL